MAVTYTTIKVNMDFSVNINPLGIPYSVKEAMSDALSYADRYPDMECQWS